MEVLDDLCEVVHDEGLLCSTPLAAVGLPGRYACWPSYYPGCHPYGLIGWISLMDAQLKHMDVWSANFYPGRPRAPNLSFPALPCAALLL